MKRITGSSSASGWVHLELNDIENIIQILKERLGEVEISDEEYQYDSLDEFIRKRGTKVLKLCLKSKNPYLSFSFNKRNGFHLFCADYDEKSKLVYAEINEFLETKKSWIGRLCNTPFRQGMLMGALSFIPFNFSFSSIILLNKHERNSFLQRNQDKIILCFVSALLTAIITHFVERTFK